jgi:hypothetical protein
VFLLAIEDDAFCEVHAKPVNWGFRWQYDGCWISALGAGSQHSALGLSSRHWIPALGTGTQLLALEPSSWHWISAPGTGSQHSALDPSTRRWVSAPGTGSQLPALDSGTRRYSAPDSWSMCGIPGPENRAEFQGRELEQSTYLKPCLDWPAM